MRVFFKLFYQSAEKPSFLAIITANSVVHHILHHWLNDTKNAVSSRFLLKFFHTSAIKVLFYGSNS